MNIIYAQNPLATRVELDDNDRKTLATNIRIDELENIICAMGLYSEEGELFDLKRVRETYKNYLSNYGEEAFSEIVKSRVKECEEELLGYHCGDCVCVACTCMKCWAEQFLGIDTTKGLGKHEGNIIDSVYRNKNISCKDAIKILEKNSIQIPAKSAEYHVKWIETHLKALEWLKNYEKYCLNAKKYTKKFKI